MKAIHWFNSFVFAFLAGMCLKVIYQIYYGYVNYSNNTIAVIVFTVIVVLSVIMSGINFILGCIEFDSEGKKK